MNTAHVHLLITHLPIFGSILGALVLIHGLWAKSTQTKIAAYNVFVLSAIGGAIAYATGEGAEESVEHLPGIAESAIERHEEFAAFALTAIIILGVAAIAGIWISLKKPSLSKTVAVVTLAFSLVTFSLVVRTGYLGGQIHHTEITSGTTASPEQGNESENHEDDD